MQMFPNGLLYTKDHEWAKVEGKVATIGISDYAQEQLGELVYVELPKVGDEFIQGKELAVVESSKAANDVYAPVTGKVTQVNSQLESKPELINEDCYGKGWICKMDVTDEASLKNLMESKQYEEYVKGL
jgi:glycine cleavage system H protein